MRDFFAILAIIAAVVGLGVFRVPDEDALIAAGLRVSAQSALLDLRHPVDIAVDGRDITVSGRVENDAERQQILTRLRGLKGVENVADALDLLPTVSPFRLHMRVAEEITVSGHVPDRALAEELAQVLAVEVALPPAVGAPDAGWGAVAVQAAQAVPHLLNGSVTLTDRQVRVVGKVHLPGDLRAVQTVLADLPEGYQAQLALKAVDDGRPYGVSIRRENRMGLRMQGKLPPDFDLAQFDVLGPAQESAFQHAPLALDYPGFEDTLMAALAVFIEISDGVLTVGPGMVSLSVGTVSPDLRAQIAALKDRMPDGYILHTSFVPPDDRQPLSLQVALEHGRVVLSGHVPRDFDVDKVYTVLDLPGEDRTTRDPYPDLQGWAAPFWEGLSALNLLENGVLSFEDGRLAVQGVAKDPQSRQRARRALGAQGLMNVHLRDDGAPPGYVFEFDAAKGASVQGKLPDGLTPGLMAEALGLPEVRGLAVVSSLGTSARSVQSLKAVQPLMDQVEILHVYLNGSELSVQVFVAPGVDPAVWRRRLGLVPAKVTVRSASAPLAGTRRMHLLRQEPQVFVDGYWLPELALLETVEQCNTADLPTIPFANESFVPSAQALWPLAHWAALARACSGISGFDMEISARAQAFENVAMNAQLARRRAEAVRQEMIKRGVPKDRLRAVRSGGEVEGNQVVARWRAALR